MASVARQCRCPFVGGPQPCRSALDVFLTAKAAAWQLSLPLQRRAAKSSLDSQGDFAAEAVSRFPKNAWIEGQQDAVYLVRQDDDEDFDVPVPRSVLAVEQTLSPARVSLFCMSDDLPRLTKEEIDAVKPVLLAGTFAYQQVPVEEARGVVPHCVFVYFFADGLDRIHTAPREHPARVAETVAVACVAAGGPH